MTSSIPSRAMRRCVVKCICLGVLFTVGTLLATSFVSMDDELSVEKSLVSSRLGRHWLPVMKRWNVGRKSTLKYDGRNKKLLSTSLVDVIDFSPHCSLESNRNIAVRSKRDGRQTTNAHTILMLHSSTHNSELRHIIRKTWASPQICAQNGIITRFVMGRPSDEATESMLTMESNTFGDILVGNFTDDVRSGTVRSLFGLQWIFASCSLAEFIVESRDDTIMLLDKLPKYISSFVTNGIANSILGHRTTDSKVIRKKDSSYFLDRSVLSHDVYPPYCSLSAAYIMPMQIATEVFKLAWNTSRFVPFIDAFVGLAAQYHGWKIRHNDAFTANPTKDDACELSNRFSVRATEVNNILWLWDNVRNAEYMRNCKNPDLDAIYAGKDADNQQYLQEVLPPIKNYSHLGCKQEGVYMIALIISHPERFQIRRVIRDTWGSEDVRSSLEGKVKIFFLVGQSSFSNPELKAALDKESEEFRDTLQGNYVDSLKNLTLKNLFGVKWAMDNCRSATYLFKSDDDMFANLQNIVHYLQQLNGRGEGLSKLYLGNSVIEERNTDKDSPYYVSSDEYNGRYFPEYCAGGYIMSMDLVDLVFHEALRTPLISSLDDVFVGIIMRKLGVQSTHHNGFLYDKGPTDKCSLRKTDFMVMHLTATPDNLREVWTNFMDPEVDCNQDVYDIKNAR